MHHDDTGCGAGLSKTTVSIYGHFCNMEPEAAKVAYEGMQNEMNRNFVSVQIRSERNRVDRENMIQVCRNPIVEDDFHGFLHRNCEGTEQLH